MRIHLIAIGGAAMHQLAIALHLNGHQVSGSDDEIFDPALTNLRRYGLIGEDYSWNPANLSKEIDLVILGMHARSDNPELIQARKLGLEVVSFPEYVYRQSIHKTRVVVGGSHGKTTITSMIMHVLKECARPFDYLVGSRVQGFDVMVSLSPDSDLIIIEGDEYLSSCLDPRPKFHAYNPHIAVISGIEWDHINVYPEFEQYRKAFEIFAASVPDNGTIIYCREDAQVNHIMDKYKGRAEKIGYNALPCSVSGDKVSVQFGGLSIPVSVFGEHNMLNMSAALEVCRKLGVSDESFFAAISSFQGAAKRLELVEEIGSSRIFRDFAHAPSKLRATVKAVRSRYPDQPLLAVFELHTFSSMNRAFLSFYSGCLNQADTAIVYSSDHAFALKRLEPFTDDEIREAFNRPDVGVVHHPDALISMINSHIQAPSNILLMSSGSFDQANFGKIVLPLK